MKIIFTIGIAALLTINFAFGQNKKSFMAFGTKMNKSYKCSHVGIQKIKKNKFKVRAVAEVREIFNQTIIAVNMEDNGCNKSITPESTAELSKTVFEVDTLHVPNLPLPSPVYFRFDTDELSYADLRQVILAVEHAKLGKSIILEGHTDFLGTDHYNHHLSVKRANKIKAMMVDLGVKASAISIVGHGESKPATLDITDKHRQLNRRVEFVVINKN